MVVSATHCLSKSYVAERRTRMFCCCCYRSKAPSLNRRVQYRSFLIRQSLKENQLPPLRPQDPLKKLFKQKHFVANVVSLRSPQVTRNIYGAGRKDSKAQQPRAHSTVRQEGEGVMEGGSIEPGNSQHIIVNTHCPD